MQLKCIAPYFRVKWTIAGTTPTFTIDVTAYLS
jgi:hypothetical protein